MANLKEIRNRIASVSSTKQITSAMKMVSAAKLRKSQTAIMQLRPYASQMESMVYRLTDGEKEDIPYIKSKKEEKKILIIALTSNKGLCSVFNSSIIKLTKNLIEKYQSEGKVVYLQSFGKKGDAVFKHIKEIDYLGSKDEIWEGLSFEKVALLVANILKQYEKGLYDKVQIVYNKFKNAALQEPVVESFLPFDINKQNKTNSNYIFEPNKVEILQSVVPLFLNTKMYRCFLDSFTSEHGARMSSMNKATDNAQTLLNDLTLTYNKLRQASITNEIIEICSGANALS
ncbi:MAG: ATP synthase F1 subunit gamma [Bacteroidota bacterium]|nr:ATP synthase F1 subunit gamma [Bacteroidota bacterium]